MPQAVLKGFARLPANSFYSGPTSGQFISAVNGVKPPFVDAQPIQGLSGGHSLGGSEYLFLTDNGFGAKTNSPDFILSLHHLRLDFRTSRGGSGIATVLNSRPLSDPSMRLGFQLVAEMKIYPGANSIAVDDQITNGRWLTGADLDPESMVVLPNGEILIGEEFGPSLVLLNARGEVIAGPYLAPSAPAVLGESGEIIGPDNTWAGKPANLPASGGFEGLALTPDGQDVFALLEKPLTAENNPLRLPLFKFNLAKRSFSSRAWYYERDSVDTSIGDMIAIDAHQLLVVERDYLENVQAKTKRLYLIDLDRVNERGFVDKRLILDLLRVADPHRLSGMGSEYSLPFVSPEVLVRVDERSILLVNDNNYPFGNGRTKGLVEDTEFALIEFDRPLSELNNHPMNAFEGLSDNQSWFDTLQGHILKPHGRDFHRLVYISLPAGEPTDAVINWIQRLPITSFRKQLDDSCRFRAGQATDVFTGLWLTATGYRKLGVSEKSCPHDPAFRTGMKAAAEKLGDNPDSDWLSYFNHDIDLLILAAADNETQLDEFIEHTVNEARMILGGNAVVHIEKGVTQRDAESFSREPFGFRDGLSNPLFLQRDIQKAAAAHGLDVFDSRAQKELVLVPDPLAPGHYGAYVVLRKLEQDVKGFMQAQRHVGERVGAEPERVAAMVVGRYRDGTPLALSPEPTGETTNNFSFAGDSEGGKCPFHAHIRKTNDRGESLKLGSGFGDERMRRIVRRSFTYHDTERPSLDFDLQALQDIDRLPSGGTGTLFISFQSSIRDQFEHIIQRFANNPDYFVPHAGRDSLIGTPVHGSEAKAWPRTWADPTSKVSTDFGSFVKPKGGLYLFAPSIAFLQNLHGESGIKSATARPAASTPRTQVLRDQLVDRAFSNRKTEWFTPAMLPHVLTVDPQNAAEPVIIRQAIACRVMLRAMASKENNVTTGTYQIAHGELLVGTIPIGSLGLGKTFPGYLTEKEMRASSLSNRDEVSPFGHTVPNYRRVLELGLEGMIGECRKHLDAGATGDRAAFYLAVVECCDAVMEYAQAFARLAEETAAVETDATRAAELYQIATVCRNVPAKPATTFHEALQSIWFVHLAQSAFCVYNSLGRLDQVLNPYFQRDLESGSITEALAVELLECFLLKGAERLNLNPSTLLDQDHLTYGTGIGTQPIYLDQVASCNNFIQNIVLGGVDADGNDASNTVTYLFLHALGGIGLATPTVNVRIHANTPASLYDAIDAAIRAAQNGHPILYNDESVIRGLVDSGLPLSEARNYALAGCWEPMLNGKNSFIFGMVNMLRAVECALNEGTLLSTDRQFLIGQKQSVRSPIASEYTSFDQLMHEVARHVQFFADKVALGTCSFYILPSAMTPTPFVSMLLDGCLERGMDQSIGGADYNIIANLVFAVPNAANALANIKRFVFEEKRWTLSQVVAALRANWGMAPVRSEYESTGMPDGELRELFAIMRRAFLEQGSKFGNNDPRVDLIARQLMDIWYIACKKSEALAREIFLAEPADKAAATLRTMSNYLGVPLKTDLRSDFELHFTSGSGTFGQYSSLGKGVSASADGRAANDPVAPNCSPVAGTATHGLEAAFSSLASLGLNRFGCAVVTDIRVDGVNQPTGYFSDLVRTWQRNGGSMLTISNLPTADVQEMLRLTDRVREGSETPEVLRPYADRFCRVGGWNSCFICLPRPQQRDHVYRAMW